MRRIVITLTCFLGLAQVAAAAPSIRSGSVNPSGWDSTSSAAASWIQQGVTGLGLGPATVQVNLAADGTTSGEWATRHVIPGPMVDGAAVAVIPVGDLEGRHLVRVVVDGASGSPLVLGELRLDRTPPVAVGASVVSIGHADAASVVFTLDDAGLSGVDPLATPTVEYERDGGWVVAAQAPAGAGPKSLQLETGHLPEGGYPVRVQVRDVAGNSAARALGSFHVDRTPPRVGDVTVTRAPSAADATAEIAFTVADIGSGVDPAVAVRAVDGLGRLVGQAPSQEGAGKIVVTPPSGGDNLIVIEATDRGGRIGRSTPVVVHLPVPPPSLAGPAPASRSASAELRSATAAPPAAVRWAFGMTRALHRRRGVEVPATIAAASTAAQWRTMLGPHAGRVDGYTTADGVIALGPTATRGLTTLTKMRACRTACPAPSRAQIDSVTRALAVLLHETLHASGPQSPEDLATAEGRAFEEGITEAVTADLLPDLVRSLPLRPALRRALLAGTRRYRTNYGPQVSWIRLRSAKATASTWTAAPAIAWRRTVADTWGRDRWDRLAASTGLAVTELRASIPPSQEPLTGETPPRGDRASSPGHLLARRNLAV